MSHIAGRSKHQMDFDRRSSLISSPHPVDERLSHVPKVVSQICPESRLVVYSDPHSMEADKFRALRVYLSGLSKTSAVKAVMITSAVAGEGKSVASLNLAVGLAEHGGSSVMLVEADLRNPSLVKRIGIEPAKGLTHCLSDDSDPLGSVRYVSDLGIYILSAGKICTNPIQILNTHRFSAIVQRLRHLVDWVIFDCPPVTPVPDVLAMRGSMDGCLWVVKSDVTSRTVVEEAIGKVGRDLVLGIILNQAKVNDGVYHSYYSYEPLTLGPGS